MIEYGDELCRPTLAAALAVYGKTAQLKRLAELADDVATRTRGWENWKDSVGAAVALEYVRAVRIAAEETEKALEALKSARGNS